MAKNTGKTDTLDIYPEHGNPSETSTKGQGPTPNQTPEQQLTMDTILHPFQRTGKDCINILNLGYDYSIGSLDKLDVTPHLQN